MKILQVHNRYKQEGGEDVVCEQEYKMLKPHFHIDRYLVDNKKQINGLLSKIRLFFTTHYSSYSKKRIKNILYKGDYNLIHVHNFFPLLTPSIFDAAVEENIASILTLHNYRLLYPNGLLMHEGNIDERSIKGSAYDCVRDGVYRGSVLQTAIVAHMIEYHRKKNTWNNKVTRFIALTEFAKTKFVEGGLPEEKISVKPNFVYDQLKGKNSLSLADKRERFFLFIGRISEEKGILTLLKTWIELPGECRILIIGSGPLLKDLKYKYREYNNIEFRGKQPREKVFEYLRKTKALVFPSEWYEGFPMTIVEAFSMGTPIITSDIGSQAEIVTDHQNGLHFKVNDTEDLAGKVLMLAGDRQLFEHLSTNARNEYEMKYTPEINFKQLKQIYQQAVGG